MIVSFNIDPADAALLDKLAGPRGRSAWLRRMIAAAYAQHQIREQAARPAAPGRKATTPRRKAA